MDAAANKNSLILAFVEIQETNSKVKYNSLRVCFRGATLYTDYI